MRRWCVLCFGAALVGLCIGPAFGQANKDQPKDKVPPKEKKADPILVPPAPPGACCGGGPGFKQIGCAPIVIVVNGEAGSTHTTDTLIDLNGELRLGLKLWTVSWTRHDSHNQDVVDMEAQMNAAARIACAVKAIRKDAPNVPIFFVGHSGGAHVVLRAAEMLPEKSVDRIIVLAPAVSCNFDLSRAIKASRGGIDNFYSSDDTCLEHMAEHVGCADGAKCAPAGLVGFRLASCDKKDIALYRNLRQYPWSLEMCGGGGHYTWCRYHNMKKTVVPLFFAPTIIYDGPALEKKMPPAR